MGTDRPDTTPPGEHASEASGEQKAQGLEGLAVEANRPPTVLSDGPEVSGLNRAEGRPQRGVPGRPRAPEPPRNRAGDVPQVGNPQDIDPIAEACSLRASAIARIAYAACQVYKREKGGIGDYYEWEDLQPGYQGEIVAQVILAMHNLAPHPARNHERWRENMRNRGLTAADVPNIGKTWIELTEADRRKAWLFEAVVLAMIRRI